MDQPSEQTDHAVPNSLKDTVNIKQSRVIFPKARKIFAQLFSGGNEQILDILVDSLDI